MQSSTVIYYCPSRQDDATVSCPLGITYNLNFPKVEVEVLWKSSIKIPLLQGFHLRPEAGRFVRSFAIPRPVL